MSPLGDDHDVHIRYFTPTTEVPICGHATIAAHYARAKWLNLGPQIVRQKTGAGIQEIHIRQEGDDYRITMRQGPLSFGVPLEDTIRERIATALGLTPDDFVRSLPVQVVSTGHSKVIIPLGNQVDLDAIAPDHDALVDISAEIGCNGFFPFQIRQSMAAAADGRMFAPAIGITEEPVTGNANGPLGGISCATRIAAA